MAVPAGAPVVIGLLRWPQPRHHGAMALPVVQMSREALGVKLLARSVDEYLHRWAGLIRQHVMVRGVQGGHAHAAGWRHKPPPFHGHVSRSSSARPLPPPPLSPAYNLFVRLLAEEDVASSGAGGPLAAAAGAGGQELYRPGGVEAEGMKEKMQMYVIRKVGDCGDDKSLHKLVLFVT